MSDNQSNTISVGESKTATTNTATVGQVETFPGETAIKNLLNDYKKIMSNPNGQSRSYVPGLVSFNKAINLIIGKAQPWAYQILWDFFVANANGVCQDNIALKGTDATTFNTSRLVWTYLLFRGMTTGRNMVMDPAPYIDKIGNPNFVLWALQQSPNML